MRLILSISLGGALYRAYLEGIKETPMLLSGPTSGFKWCLCFFESKLSYWFLYTEKFTPEEAIDIAFSILVCTFAELSRFRLALRLRTCCNFILRRCYVSGRGPDLESRWATWVSASTEFSLMKLFYDIPETLPRIFAFFICALAILERRCDFMASSPSTEY